MDTYVKCPNCRINFPFSSCGNYPPADAEVHRKRCPECVSLSKERAKQVLLEAKKKGELRKNAKKLSSSKEQNSSKQKKLKRWVVMDGAGGRKYYHNTETGKDQWEKPADLDADSAGAPAMHKFVRPSDVTKDRLMWAEKKRDAEKQFGVTLPASNPNGLKFDDVAGLGALGGAAQTAEDDDKKFLEELEKDDSEPTNPDHFLSAAATGNTFVRVACPPGWEFKTGDRGLGYYAPKGYAGPPIAEHLQELEKKLKAAHEAAEAEPAQGAGDKGEDRVGFHECHEDREGVQEGKGENDSTCTIH